MDTRTTVWLWRGGVEVEEGKEEMNGDGKKDNKIS